MHGVGVGGYLKGTVKLVCVCLPGSIWSHLEILEGENGNFLADVQQWRGDATWPPTVYRTASRNKELHVLDINTTAPEKP